MTWETTPGDRERTTYVFDLVLFVERTSDDDRVIADTDDLIDLVQAAYVSGITLGQTAQTTQCVIRGGASNEWGKVGGAEYLLTTFRLELAASRQRATRPRYGPCRSSCAIFPRGPTSSRASGDRAEVSPSGRRALAYSPPPSARAQPGSRR